MTRDHLPGGAFGFDHGSPLAQIAAVARRYGLRTTDAGVAPGHPARSWHTYPPKDRMPNAPVPVAPDNPFRHPRGALRAGFMDTPGPSADGGGAGLTVEDLNVLMGRHYRHGRQVGAREALDEHHAELAEAYDVAWQRGIEEQHRNVGIAYGQRVHALHELLHLVPQLSAERALLLDVATLAKQVLASILADHARSPFGLMEAGDDEGVPAPVTPASDPDVATAQAADDAMRARVVQLRDWLREQVDYTAET